MAYTKACLSLELQTRPRFRPVSLSLSLVWANTTVSTAASVMKGKKVLAPARGWDGNDLPEFPGEPVFPAASGLRKICGRFAKLQAASSLGVLLLKTHFRAWLRLVLSCSHDTTFRAIGFFVSNWQKVLLNTDLFSDTQRFFYTELQLNNIKLGLRFTYVSKVSFLKKPTTMTGAFSLFGYLEWHNANKGLSTHGSNFALG